MALFFYLNDILPCIRTNFELWNLKCDFIRLVLHQLWLLTHCSMKQMEKNMPIKIILARSCIFLRLDFYASISWAEEICRTIWVKAKISNSGSSESIKTIVRSCKCNLKLFKVCPSNAWERLCLGQINGRCHLQIVDVVAMPMQLLNFSSNTSKIETI